MKRTFSRLSVGGLATLAVVACTDTTGSTNSALSAAALAAALGSVPVGYGDLTTSFIGALLACLPLDADARPLQAVVRHGGLLGCTGIVTGGKTHSGRGRLVQFRTLPGSRTVC